MVASHYGHAEVVKELAQRNADLDLSTVSIKIVIKATDIPFNPTWL